MKEVKNESVGLEGVGVCGRRAYSDGERSRRKSEGNLSAHRALPRASILGDKVADGRVVSHDTLIQMPSDRGHQTQWTAQFAVASELCKRGYEVAFTSGHTTPIADLMAVSPIKKEMFLVDVKGLYRENPWIIRRKMRRKNLFYILAFVPIGKPNRYFILSQETATSLIKDELRRLSRPDNYPVTGFSFKLGALHESAWEALPS